MYLSIPPLVILPNANLKSDEFGYFVHNLLQMSSFLPEKTTILIVRLSGNT